MADLLLSCCRCVIDCSRLFPTHRMAVESSTSHPSPLPSAPIPRPSSLESATPLPAKTWKKSPNYSKYTSPSTLFSLSYLLTISPPVHDPLAQRIRNRLRPTRPLLQREQSPPPLRHQPPRRAEPKSPHQLLLSRLGINRHGQTRRRQTSQIARARRHDPRPTGARQRLRRCERKILCQRLCALQGERPRARMGVILNACTTDEDSVQNRGSILLEIGDFERGGFFG